MQYRYSIVHTRSYCTRPYPEVMSRCPLCVYSWWNGYENYIKEKFGSVLIYRMNIRLGSFSIIDLDA